MLKLNVLTVIIMASGLIALASCGSGGSMGVNPATGLVDKGAPASSHGLGAKLPVLPKSSGVAARGASDLVEIMGSAAIDSAGSTIQDNELVLASSATDLGWALYKVDGLTGRQPTSIEISVKLDAVSSPYSVGISNYSTGAWDFLAVSSDPHFSADLSAEVARLANEIGELYFVVVVNGGAGLTVHSASLESQIDDNPDDNLPWIADGLAVSEGLPDRIELSWAAADGATSYELWRRMDNADGSGKGGDDDLDGHGDMSLLATLDGATTSYTDMDIVLSTEYKYQVRSISAAGPAGFSDDESGYAGTAPVDDNGGNAGGLVVSEGLPASIDMSWDAVADATGYEIWRKLDGGTPEDPFTLLIAVDGATTSFSDTVIVLSTEYSYEVRAILASGPADFSDAQSGYAGDPPGM